MHPRPVAHRDVADAPELVPLKLSGPQPRATPRCRRHPPRAARPRIQHHADRPAPGLSLRTEKTRQPVTRRPRRPPPGEGHENDLHGCPARNTHRGEVIGNEVDPNSSRSFTTAQSAPVRGSKASPTGLRNPEANRRLAPLPASISQIAARPSSTAMPRRIGVGHVEGVAHQSRSRAVSLHATSSSSSRPHGKQERVGRTRAAVCITPAAAAFGENSTMAG